MDNRIVELPEGSYVVMAGFGNCKLCGAWQDLRCGSCFNCSKHVAGRAIEGGHELWDKRNPKNRWLVKAN